MRDLKQLTGRQVIVAARDLSLRGVIETASADFLTLTGAEELEPGGDPKPIDGLMLVRASAIDFVQVVP